MPDVFFVVLLLGAIFFGAVALVDVFSRRDSQPRMLLRAVASLQVGLVCLAGALTVVMPAGWLLLLGGFVLSSGVIWLGYGLYLMFW